MKILFLCVANSARSQLAEALARMVLGSTAEVFSAGSNPSGYIQPLAIEVLNEIGLDVSNQRSKSISDLPKHAIAKLDYIVTLCEDEVCPVLTNDQAKKLHWPVQDPVSYSEVDRLEAFRRARDLILTKIKEQWP